MIGTDLAGLKVLVAEDDPLIAEDVCATLRERGAEVVAADSVQRALAMVSEGIDLAILDVRLADGDVHPVADHLARLGIPFAFHSGSPRLGGLSRAYPAAATLTKPASPGALSAALERRS